MKVPITRRDDEIARSILRRVGSEDHGALTRLLQGLNPPDGRPPIAEVHWRYRHAGFEEGGTFWPTLPDTFDEFVEMLRAHSCSVFYEETLPACGIAVDPEAFPL